MKGNSFTAAAVSSGKPSSSSKRAGSHAGLAANNLSKSALKFPEHWGSNCFSIEQRAGGTASSLKLAVCKSTFSSTSRTSSAGGTASWRLRGAGLAALAAGRWPAAGWPRTFRISSSMARAWSPGVLLLKGIASIASRCSAGANPAAAAIVVRHFATPPATFEFTSAASMSLAMKGGASCQSASVYRDRFLDCLPCASPLVALCRGLLLLSASSEVMAAVSSGRPISSLTSIRISTLLSVTFVVIHCSMVPQIPCISNPTANASA
mmetsp:Transcript_45776/g.83887  ORF Transcript_45776/g.83887 Transcript_45776/m.83887 type:complete len:265 (-) Transcript_45776:431-1225(-)